MSAGPGPRTLAPGMKARNFSATWKRLIHELRPERWRIGLVIALTAVSVVLNVLAPKVLARATNLIFEGVIGTLLGHLGLPAGMSGYQLVAALRAAGQDTYVSMLSAYDVVVGQGLDTRALLIVLAQVLALYLTSAVFLWLQGRILAGVVQRTASRMRGEVEAKLARVPLSYIDRGSRGDMLSRVTNDVDNVSQTLQQTLSQAFNSIITVIGVFAMMLTVSWQLTLVAVVTIPLAMLISVLIARQAKPHFTQQWKATGEVSGVVEEAFTGHEAVVLFNSEEIFADLFEQANNRLYEGSYKAQWISGTIQPAMRVVSNLNFVIIAVVGGIRITQGAMTLGDVQAFIQYSQQFSQPLAQLGGMATAVQSGTASAERIFELLDAEEERADEAGAEALAPVGSGAAAAGAGAAGAGVIEMEHVRFSYDPDSELITDLSLKVEPGQTVAIVGPTGAGKTTLVNLLMRFYEIDGGRITLDGVDTSAMRRRDVRARTGMVLQDPWLFAGTIRENIRYGRPGASDEQVEAAARACYVDHIIRALPDGYDTVLDEDAANVSAGERQLLTIARAFIADPAVLILDEATSSVDTRTELLVQHAMAALRQGRTSFVIAHRLSTIRDADTILVMEHGDIVEQGSHEELLERRGAYWALYQSQFAGAAEGTAA